MKNARTNLVRESTKSNADFANNKGTTKVDVETTCGNPSLLVRYFFAFNLIVVRLVFGIKQ